MSEPEQGPEVRENRRPRVAVVFGGRSGEHSISCVTAGSVLRALDEERYDVVPVGIARDGRWVLESGDPDRLAITSPDALPEVDGSRATVALGPPAGDGATGEVERGELLVHEPGAIPRTLGEVDVVFPLLHGPWGEDGTLQGLLEMAGVRYVGAGVLASAIGMDKHYMKIVLQAHGLPVLPYAVIDGPSWEHDPAACAETVDSLGYPVFVKPARGGSSLGISKVHDRGGLADAVEEARRHDPKVLVEVSAEGGREIECGVLQGFGSDAPDASVVAEVSVDPEHEFYDFAAKYLPEQQTGITVPADLPEALVAQIQGLAVRAFQVMSVEGLARVDFFVLPGDRVVINEINTMPGFTPTSMFPRMWQASGLDYPQLVDRLVQLALHRPTGLR